MIVYNCGRRFFALKADAERYRRETGLKHYGVIKLSITHRDQLAALLDGICSLDGNKPDTTAVAQIEQMPKAGPPADIPRFLLPEWGYKI